MKKNFIALCALIAAPSIMGLGMRPSMQDTIRVLPTQEEINRQLAQEAAQSVKKPKTAQQAFDKVLPKLRAYESKATPAERRNFVEYLNYYKSWYQATPPAPREITNQLTNNDHTAEYAIKFEAQDFVQEPTQNDTMPRMGASKLSRAGEDFYLMVINHLQEPVAQVNKPMPHASKPTEQIKPAKKPFFNL